MHHFSPNILIFLLLIHAFSANSCLEPERDALLEFKAGVGDISNRLASWRGNKCCDWAGITCSNQTGHVVKLNLRNTNFEFDDLYGDFIYEWNNHSLTGKISPSLVSLSDLKYIDLSFNNFSGNKFPEFISSFKNLKYLNLSHTGFSGMVPPQLGNLSKLLYLDLSCDLNYDVSISGFFTLNTHTRWLSNLRSLRYMDMSGVDFQDSNDWVESLNKLPSLEVLVLSENNLTQISNALAFVNFTSLRVLHISYQNFNSTIPNWLGSLHNLTVLILEDSDLVGPYPDTLGNLTSLSKLALSDYSLDGMIPPLHSLTRLTYLSLAGNNIGGDIREFLGKLSNYTLGKLQYLDISETQLTGTLYGWIGAMTGLSDLSLSYNNLTGTIPIDIGNLTNLVDLDLRSNNLRGTIPIDIGNLTNLVDLDLRSNNLRGTIPIDIGNLTNLVDLDLSNNNLRGTIPIDIGNLTNLVDLDLSDNNLRGTIPIEIGNLTNLIDLDLSHNNLTGTIPIEFRNLSNLVDLYLGDNSLTGLLSEAQLNGLLKLKILDLSENNLTVFLGSNWTPSFQLNTIQLKSCKLGPKFPAWLQRQIEIESIDLSDTRIDDNIPSWLWSLPSLQNLDLSNNRLRGSLPASLVHMTKLIRMGLSNNRLEGEIPFLPRSLYYLNLSNNSLSGQLRKYYKSPDKKKPVLSNNHTAGEVVELFPCGLTNLMFLDLSSNNLLGQLPPCWSNISDELNFANNKLSGPTPSSLSCSEYLRGVSFNNNNLTGEFPMDLKFCSGLKLLDLGENKYHGEIPNWVGENLRQLRYLRLRSNLFFGNIPSTLTYLKNLQVIDFGDNHLTGQLPSHLDNFTMVSNVGYFSGNSLDETLEARTKRLNLVFSYNLFSIWKSIDLSNNSLTGEIPQNIVALTGLLNLNLSLNHFIGEIPFDIGNMTSLESLDLQMNSLSGNIPQSISALYSLEALNLSYNNLSGSIPSGRQLQSLDDPSIYSGNPNLCGPPLKTSCQSIGRFPDSDGNNDSKSKHAGSWDKWLYLFFELGFVVGFLVVFFILLFKRKWRYAFFRMVDSWFDSSYVLTAVALKRREERA